MRVIIPTLVGLVALAATSVQASTGPLSTAPARQMARDPGAERTEEPAVRLSCCHQRQLSVQSDEKGMRADQRS